MTYKGMVMLFLLSKCSMCCDEFRTGVADRNPDGGQKKNPKAEAMGLGGVGLELDATGQMRNVISR